MNQSATAIQTRVKSRRAGLAAVGTAAILAGAFSVPAMAEPAPENAGAGTCIPVSPDNPLSSSGQGRWTDNNPNVYVAGNAVFENHEGEGLVVVDGDATFDVPAEYPWPYMVGTAGGGSGSWPEVQALMLAVQGNLTATGLGMTIGNGDHPGSWFVGGDVTGEVLWAQKWVDGHTENGQWVEGGNVQLRIDQAQLEQTPAYGHRARLNNFESAISALGATGSVAGSATGLTLTGDAQSSVQVFEIDYPAYQDVLTASQVSFDLVDVPAGASIILNVVGGDNIVLTGAVRYTLNGQAINPPVPPYTSWGNQDLGAWGALTQRLLGHFPDQSSVQLGLGAEDHEQFVGSIFASAEGTHLSTYASTNGRIISFGDFTMYEGDGATGNRAEFHAFPFLFPGLGCSGVTDGTFSVAKTVQGLPADYELPQGTVFKVRATWLDAGGQSVSEELALPADGTPVVHEGTLPADTTVVFEEIGIELPEGQSLPNGCELRKATFSPSSVVIGATQAGTVAVTLTNMYSAGDSPDTGSGTFSLMKVVQDREARALSTDAAFQIEAAWGEGADDREVIEVPADGQAHESGLILPEGTEVTFTELSPPVVEGYEFEGVSFSPESITIAEGTTPTVTATNTYAEADVESGSFAVRKALAGVDAGKFPADTVFNVTASWDEGSVVLALPVTGEAVAGPELPVGTVVRFSEAVAPVVEGYGWQGVEFSVESVTVSAGDVAEVVATNTYKSDNPGGPDDGKNEGEKPEGGGKLPVTGAAGVALIAVIAAGLLGTGAVAIRRSRKQA